MPAGLPSSCQEDVNEVISPISLPRPTPEGLQQDDESCHTDPRSVFSTTYFFKNGQYFGNKKEPARHVANRLEESSQDLATLEPNTSGGHAAQSFVTLRSLLEEVSSGKKPVFFYASVYGARPSVRGATLRRSLPALESCAGLGPPDFSATFCPVFDSPRLQCLEHEELSNHSANADLKNLPYFR